MILVEFIQFTLTAGLILLVTLFLALYLSQKLTVKPYPIIRRNKGENSFLDPENVDQIEFPSIDDEPSIELSVIIPAFNEERRLPKMIKECLEYLENKSKQENSLFTYEIIVVSDGSTDNTVQCALKYTKKYSCNKVRVLELIENRGKGGAVRLGMLSARGKYLLFADADGATKFSDYEKLEQNMKAISGDWEKPGIVIGSRAHLEEQAIATRSAFRTFLMYGFHTLVYLFAVKKIRDTQCGFKLFSRSAGRILFKSLHVERWAFDVELLYIAQTLQIQIVEIAVNWTEIEGSKLAPFWSWLQMGIDLFLIWFRYLIGAWKIKKLHSS